jgi:hypothetical protein
MIGLHGRGQLELASPERAGHSRASAGPCPLRFVIHVDSDQGRIEAVVRPEAIQTAEGEEMRPVLRPTALELAGNKQHDGLPWR